MNIDGTTRIYGLFGYPVKHTLSPCMHNAAFAATGLNAVYLPFEVKPQEIKLGIKAVKALGISGINITIPHKEKCIPFLDGLSDEAKAIGAVNTIVNRKGKLIGYNTDGTGFMTALNINLHFAPKGKSVFILGAGGAAKAVATVLAMGGVKKIILCDVVRSRAVQLVRQLKGDFKKLQAKVWNFPLPVSKLKLPLDIDLLVNATPVGMKYRDPLLVAPGSLREGLTIFDLVYNHPETKLVSLARAKGLKADTGLGMLLFQGAIAFSLWTQKKAPLEIMRKALLKAMGRV
jgi:shikimate dehydrogenase